MVGAFGRTRYVERAVASVLAQTLPRSRFEVVVTRDVPDPTLDRAWTAAGVRTIVDAEPRIGRWLARAARATRAPLIAFLDDDDEFEPERLACVVELFRERPEVGYYRNRVRVVDADGRAVDPARWRRLEKDVTLDRTGPIAVAPNGKGKIVQLIGQETFAGFNSSTIVIRRELLDGAPGDAFEATQLPDLALLVAAIVSPYGLYLDDRRLTRFRTHSENVTHAVGWLGRAAEAHRALAELADRRGRPDLAAWLRERSAHYARVFRSSTIVLEVRAAAPRRRVAELTFDYLRFLGAHPAQRRATMDVWRPTVYAATYLLSPAVGHRVALARVPERPR